MNEVLLHEAIKLNRVRKRRQRWQKVVSIMAAVVVFCTTYALILPAITMGEEPICGQEAHEHTDACYQTRLYTVTCPAAQHVHDASCVDGMGNYTCGFGQVILHSHDESCYDDQGGLICVLQEQYEHLHSDSCVVTTKQLVCQETEREAHTHAESCYGEKQVLTCQTPETPAHTHGESCYGDIKTLVCTQQEYPAHTHSDACYTQTLVLSCTQPETAPHTHSDACNEIRQNLVCTLEENEQHSHSGSCYQTETVRVCGLEETAGHTHGEACYTKEQQLSCTAQEGEGHTHGDSCYHTEKGLICQLAETEGHTHGTACYTTETGLVCALEETAGHTHTESCYEEASTVACGLEQIAVHTHTSECYDASGSRICGITPAAVHVHGEQCVEVTQLEEPQLICQIPEHVHVDSCYPVENPTIPVDEGFLCGYGVHTHTENCYNEEGTLTCNIPEHTHDASCKVADYDENADVESSADWEATLANVKLTGNWPKDILAVAESQLGYRESAQNVYLCDDGSLKGYTRYGAWYGIPYGDWCAMFVSFCVDYAGAEDVPQDANCNSYITQLSDAGMYYTADTYTPKPGDIIFFDWDYTEGAAVNSDHVGFVAELICDDDGNPVQVKTLEGNSGNRVQYVTYYLNDPVIVGYGNVPEGNTTMLTFQGTDYTVTVSFDSAANIPDNAELAVREIEQGTEEYETYLRQAIDAMQAKETQTQISFARFFDISFVVDGHAIEPGAPVNVQVSYAEAVSIAEEESSAAVHFADEGIEILEAEASQSQATDENLVDTFEFIQNSFSVTGIVVANSADADRIAEGKLPSGASLTYNRVKDAFIKSAEYAKYYNANSPIGTAGSFHIVAFDTATLNTHTNGNILTKNLNAGSNFGTNNYADELTYVQEYLKINGTSASSTDHRLAIGSGNFIDLTDNGNSFAINGTKIDKPKYIIQDRDTDETPLIDLDRVKAEISQISANLKNFDDGNIYFVKNEQVNEFNLTTPNAVGVINVDYTASHIFGMHEIHLGGFQSDHNGSIVINVDCAGASVVTLPNALVNVDGKLQPTSEVVDFSNGKVLWNFLNAEDVTIEARQMTGMIVAPGATVNINQNLNGTVVADNVNVKAESHRTDFTGKIVPYDEEPEENSVYVILQKIKSGFVGTTLPGAEFNLYVWTSSEWAKVNTESIVTNSNGLFVLKDLADNTAYKLVETKAPSGYELSGEPHYFWVRTDSSLNAPEVKPDDFEASPVQRGDIVIIPNEPAENVQTTSLTIKKSWMSSGVAMEEVDVTQITVQVYRHAWLNREEVGKERYQEKTLTAKSDWELTLTELPLNGKDSQDQEVTYTYSVEEVLVDGYTVTYSENNVTGVAGDTVVITNTKEEESGYTLPQTGGPGRTIYTLAGFVLVCGAAFLMYIQQKRRRVADAL